MRFLSCLLLTVTVGQAVPDRPFLQDRSVQMPNAASVDGALFQKLCVDADGVVYVLTDRGVARVYDDTLTLDRSFRPLAGRVAVDISQDPGGNLYYLFDNEWLSNGDSGRPLGHVPAGRYHHLAVAGNGSVLLSGDEGLAIAKDGATRPIAKTEPLRNARLWWLDDAWFAAAAGQLVRVDLDGRVTLFPEMEITALSRRGHELIVGTRHGYLGIDARSGEELLPLQSRVPVPEITSVHAAPEGLWFGTARGAFFQRPSENLAASGDLSAAVPRLPDGPGGIRFYASRRWLKDDGVVDMAIDPAGDVWVLTKTGLSRIEFRSMTLAQKAVFFEEKIRSRHIRFGLSAERRLPNAGDLASSEMIDTDNDGGWSSYYLASQAFRFAVTGRERARANAWQVFAGLERLQTINPLPGFSARTFERAGFKFSDPDRWRAVPGGDWEWKGHTSSDEIASQTFAHAAMWECVARTESDRQRIATNYVRMVDHIIAHQWYLVDVDGKPTLWGRWNPEYVNHYPLSIFDRRLNSSEITASLELAYAMTGRAVYREKAEELFNRYGYLTNIVSSMTRLKPTLGYVHLGNEMGDEWNHSDDELAFVTYWVLARFAFTPELRQRFQVAIRDHWDIERVERYPMWNFIYAGCGGSADCDAPGAVWTLRGFPLDTISWRIENSFRHDLTPLPPNFMRYELKELLPPGERQITRCNTQPFILDGGDGGHTEFPGEEYLLGYWLGRYLEQIGAPRP